MRSDYLEAPLLARFASPVAFRDVRPFLSGGIAPSVELRCSGYTTPIRIDLWSSIPAGTVPLDCESQRRIHSDRGQVFGGGLLLNRGRQQLTLEVRRTRGQNIAGYGECCSLRNDVTSILIGASHRLH